MQAIVVLINIYIFDICGPCIVIYLRNKDQKDAPETSSTLIVLAASQRRCMINNLCCIYSKLPPDDE